MDYEAEAAGDDAPAWVKKAGAASGAGAVPQSLSELLGDDELALNMSGGEDFHTEFDDEAHEQFATDNTPMASAGIDIDKIKPGMRPVSKPRMDVDAQTIILEVLFPHGIPVHDIKKAVFMTGVIDGLIAYADGDIESLSAIAVLIASHKVN